MQFDYEQYNNTGLVWTYEEFLKSSISRDNFIPAKQLFSTIQNNEPIAFLPTDLEECNMQDEKYQHSVYKIVLTGVVPTGEKLTVILDGINPYFEVQVPDEFSTISEMQPFIDKLYSLVNAEQDTTPIKTTMIKAKPFKGYQPNKSSFIRLYYNSLKKRAMALKVIREKRYITTADDKSSYYKVVCRDELTTFSSWTNVTNYTVVKNTNDYTGKVANVPMSQVSTLHNNTVQTNQPAAQIIQIAAQTTQPATQTAELVMSQKVDLKEKIKNELSSRYKNITIRVNYKNYKRYSQPITNEMKKDKTLSVCWDIETKSTSGDVPQAKDAKGNRTTDSIFSISETFQWVNEVDPFLSVCMCDYPSNPRPKHLTIVCGTERNIIKCFGDVFARMRPEFIFGFNDSDYDWPWVINRASDYPKLLCELAASFDNTYPTEYFAYTDENVLKYKYCKELIKAEAGTFIDSYSFQLPGYIPVDVRSVYRNIMEYKTSEESSLKFFLSNNKLPSKDDMPYEVLFKIIADYDAFMALDEVSWDRKSLDVEIAESKAVSNVEIAESKAENNTTSQTLTERYLELKEKLADINKYCAVDSRRCHDLLYVRSLIVEAREIADLSFVSMYDAFYRANGMKVRNLTIAMGQCQPFNIRFSNISIEKEEEGKYPGAFVLPPKKGLKVTKLSIEERIQLANGAVRLEPISQPNQPSQTTSQPNQPTTVSQPNQPNQTTNQPTTVSQPNQSNQTTNQSNPWRNVTPQRLAVYNQIIEEYGPCQTKAQIKQIEEKYNLLEPCFVEFLLEKIGRPVTGLDFSSLYPSLIRAYNLSPEYWVSTEKQAKQLQQQGIRLEKVEFYFNEIKRQAWFIWHNNKLSIKKADGTPDPEFNFGIYPYILNDLFNKRAILKKELKAIDHKIEHGQYANEAALVDLRFERSCINSKQNALKVFMNTFYGEAGSAISPFFVLELAGGITSLGKRNIQLGYKFVTGYGCDVSYGDTDSLYLSVPERYFIELDKQFYTGKIAKLEYWTKLVQITMVEIKPIREGVNKMFTEDNCTNFLTMAYEEVLFPVAFTAKKKYFGVPHETAINFKPDALFIRGLDIKKRGTSEIMKRMIYEILWDCVDPNNLLDLIQLVQRKIDIIYNSRWDMSDFITTGVYRPNRDNVKLRTFVQRMTERGIVVKPNERFNYVIVKKYPYCYDHRGRKVNIQVGDKIELVENAKRDNCEIDLDYYMQGSINGQLARLITYHDMFYVEPADDTDASLTIAEKSIYAHACKYIEDYCSKYYAKYNTFGKTFQKIFRKANNIVSSQVQQLDQMSAMLLSSNVQLDDLAEWIYSRVKKEAIDKTKNYGKETVQKQLDSVPKPASMLKPTGVSKSTNIKSNVDDVSDLDEKSKLDRHQYQAKIDNKIGELQKTYYVSKRADTCIRDIQLQAYTNTKAILERRTRESLENIKSLYSVYNNGLTKLMSIIKNAISISDDYYRPVAENKEFQLEDFGTTLEDEQLNEKLEREAKQHIITMYSDPTVCKILADFKKLYLMLLANEVMYQQVESVVQYLKILRDKRNKIISVPSKEALAEMSKPGIELDDFEL